MLATFFIASTTATTMKAWRLGRPWGWQRQAIVGADGLGRLWSQKSWRLPPWLDRALRSAGENVMSGLSPLGKLIPKDARAGSPGLIGVFLRACRLSENVGCQFPALYQRSVFSLDLSVCAIFNGKLFADPDFQPYIPSARRVYRASQGSGTGESASVRR